MYVMFKVTVSSVLKPLKVLFVLSAFVLNFCLKKF